MIYGLLTNKLNINIYKYNWTSSDESIAKVDYEGYVVGVKSGKAKSSSTGLFKIKIPKQKYKTKISVVTKDSKGKVIKTKTITVVK